MRNRKGFTLIELMVVILIVAILAAVLAPMLTGRIRQAKWTEGKTGAGTIATALRAFAAENEGLTDETGAAFDAAATSFAQIGITDNDLVGKYFSVTCYTLDALAYDSDTRALTYIIRVTAPATTMPPGDDYWTLTEGGVWAYTP